MLSTEPSPDSSESLDGISSTARKGIFDLKSSHSSLASAMKTSHSAIVFLVSALLRMARVSFVIFDASRKGMTKAMGDLVTLCSFAGLSQPASHPILNLDVLWA